MPPNPAGSEQYSLHKTPASQPYSQRNQERENGLMAVPLSAANCVLPTFQASMDCGALAVSAFVKNSAQFPSQLDLARAWQAVADLYPVRSHFGKESNEPPMKIAILISISCLLGQK